MSRLINRPITVTLGPSMRPKEFRFAGGRHRIKEVEGTFLQAKPWWENPLYMQTGPEHWLYWRVRTVDGGLYDLVHDEGKPEGQWYLYRAHD